MSTHRRAWLIRAAVLVVVAATGLAVAPGYAFAADPQVTITQLDNTSLTAGQSTTLKFKIANTNGQSTDVHVKFNGDLQGVVTCQGQCNFTSSTIQDNQEFSVTLATSASSVPAGQTKNGQVEVDVTAGSTASATADLSVAGPSAPQAVPQLSGQVVDIYKGTGVANAKVAAQDSANPVHNWTVGTDKNGNFKIVSTSDKPIAPGFIAFVVTKDGYTDYRQPVQGSPGVAITNLRFAMTPSGAASPSVTPSLAPTGSPVSSLADDNTVAATGNGSGGGGLSWVLIAIGAVLVALGIGAIVLLLVRRKGDDDDEDEPGGRGPRGGPGGRPGGRPPQPGRRPEPTAVMRGGPGRPPGGPGPRGDQTMIARSPLADMPTQMHGRVGPPGGPPPGPGYGQNPYASGQYGGGPGGHGGPGSGGPGGGGPGGHGGGAYPGYPGGSSPPNYGQTDPYGNAYGPHQGGGYGQGGYGPGEPEPRAPRQGPPDRRVDWLED